MALFLEAVDLHCDAPFEGGSEYPALPAINGRATTQTPAAHHSI